MEKTATKKKSITVTVTVGKELGGMEIAKHLLEIGVYKKNKNN
jgi:hypothetical protein